MYYFISSPVLLLCVSYTISTLETRIKWPSAQQEALDEVNDAKIIKAVQQSMAEWSIKSHKHQRKKRAVKKVCYNEVGCFEDSGPFSYLEMLPSPPEEINTKFYFYSTKNRSEQPLLELPFVNMTEAFQKSSNESLNESIEEEPTSAFSKFAYTMEDMDGFDELSTRVIVHGFGSACPHVWIYEMKTALMAVENCIVICVDWENGATLPNYVRAAANTRLVGKQLAMLLRNLQEHKGLNLAKTHIIGFSLGAHAAGFAGAELPGLKRITGLDPAGPLFESQHPKVRLDNTDAEFVDVIHSNGENLILGGLGSWQPMGDVDFYPNGGRVQTGCSNLFVGAITDFVWSQAAEVEGRSLCNHRRAYKFFIDSVAPRCQFPAFSCNSYEDFLKGQCFPCKEDGSDIGKSKCGNMGYYADRSTGRGQLYLVTREEEPFCAHQFHIEIHNSFNDLPLRTIGKLEATLEGEGGLNETFLITEKEDAEFFAGDVVSKIIVPHPALGFPTKLTLQYKSYSGWLTKGLPHWDIDKVILTDSYDRSHSLCKPSLSLSSGMPVHMSLLPGICDIPEESATTVPPTTSELDQPGQDRVGVDGEDGVESVKNRKDILNLGANFKISKNRTYTLEANGNSYEILPWQPILEGNALDRDQIAESSRSLRSEDREIYEPILKSNEDHDSSSTVVSKGRNLHVFDEKEIVEPILKPTTPKTRKVKEITYNSTESKKPAKSQDNGPMTVQLFPFRLGELLERAERYARETLLPLISEQAPKFFGFGTAKEPSERKPRYIPRYEELAFQRSERRQDNHEKSLVSAESQNRRNILDLSRPQRADEQRKFTTTDIYYVNKIGKTWDLRTDGIELASDLRDPHQIRIDLPTYRPPVKRSTTDLITTDDSSSKKQKAT
ncbi:uncharacterized protein LOC119657613 isoform X2 [Hermetia illucens]|uniref:uncharacterized protein LOC119657613 isoform X2 n=1 Tax=Hermetia illucens TaxID=343691 RepID=UPI0018CC5938|nr:uncharacterized protein LOC119657613 isoform X2 [Hermetia illucens]